MIMLRRGTRKGKFSKLTPELEKKMGEANSAYINQEFARAVDILLHIIQSAPHAEGPYHTLGLIYEERNEKAKAIEAYLLAAHMSKRDWGLWKRVAKMASESGQHQHAIYCWSRVLLAEPDNDEIRWQRAVSREAHTACWCAG
jgi:general transcription factor 3C polypeptide 3 (transcription factor C subunit 4)